MKNFDDYSDTLHPDWVAQRGMDSKSVTALLDEKVTQLKQSGQAEDIAYIQAMNELLPSRIQAYGLLKTLIKTEIDASGTAFTDTVKQVIEANDGNLERSTVTLTTPEYRIEVIADVTYESVTDSATSYIKDIVKEIPQKGNWPVDDVFKRIVLRGKGSSVREFGDTPMPSLVLRMNCHYLHK